VSIFAGHEDMTTLRYGFCDLKPKHSIDMDYAGCIYTYIINRVRRTEKNNSQLEFMNKIYGRANTHETTTD
jgi:hypothetical protein